MSTSLGLRTLIDGFQELVKSFREQTDPVISQLVGYFLDRDPNVPQSRHGAIRGFHILSQTGPRMTVIAESIEGCRRNGVHSVGPDQFLDVHHVAVVRILGAGAGPENALCLRTLRRQFPPAVT